MEPDYDKLVSLYQQDLSALKDDETAELALHPGLAGEDLLSNLPGKTIAILVASTSHFRKQPTHRT